MTTPKQHREVLEELKFYTEHTIYAGKRECAEKTQHLKTLDFAISLIKRVEKLPTKKDILEIMLAISKKKGQEQIKEVQNKGLWEADCITVELEEFVEPIVNLYTKHLGIDNDPQTT